MVSLRKIGILATLGATALGAGLTLKLDSPYPTLNRIKEINREQAEIRDSTHDETSLYSLVRKEEQLRAEERDLHKSPTYASEKRDRLFHETVPIYAGLFAIAAAGFLLMRESRKPSQLQGYEIHWRDRGENPRYLHGKV